MDLHTPKGVEIIGGIVKISQQAHSGCKDVNMTSWHVVCFWLESSWI